MSCLYRECPAATQGIFISQYSFITRGYLYMYREEYCMYCG